MILNCTVYNSLKDLVSGIVVQTLCPSCPEGKLRTGSSPSQLRERQR